MVLVSRDGAAGDGAAVREAVGGLAELAVVGVDGVAELVAGEAATVVVADAAVAAELQAPLGADHGGFAPVGVVILGESGPPPVPGAVMVARGANDVTLRGILTLALECVALRRRVGQIERDDRSPLLGPHTAAPLDDPNDVEWYDGILTRSPAMRAILGTLRDLEGSDVTVLLEGETGTGKELAARAIHARSGRERGPFVAVNLGAISDSLRESELFGHVRGAFTGAREARGGAFGEAHRGTIFLDEVGEASPALQVALLRVLEEGTIQPLGADRSRPVDVRVVSATNQDLGKLLGEGRFRRDLYYRLNVVSIRLPPLRERREDVFPLAELFLRRAAKKLGREPTGVSRDARIALEAHAWDGNVRELRNVMERAALHCKGSLIVAADLPLGSPTVREPDGGVSIGLPPRGASLRELERQIFMKTLALTEGNQSQAARILGLHESTFRFRLRRVGIERASGS